MNFIIVPAINIVYQIFIAAYPPIVARDSYWESFLVFFMVSNTAKPFQFFFVIRKTFLIDAKAYIANRELVEDMTEDQLTVLYKEIKDQNQN